MFGPSVIGLETEATPAASSAYSATPLSLSALAVQPGSATQSRSARCRVHGVYEGMRAATRFRYGRLMSAFVTARMKSEMDYWRGSAIPRKDYWQATLVGRFDCGEPAHIYQKPDFSNDDSMENEDSASSMQPVVYNN